MSRIGKKPIPIPTGVTVKTGKNLVEIKGPGGSLSQEITGPITVTEEGGQLLVERLNDEKKSRSLHGLYRQLIANMVKGVVEPFTKKLEIVGVGYNAKKQGNDLVMNVGFCHSVTMTPPEMVGIDVPNPQTIIISSPDKQKAGQFAAEIRRVRPPDAYKGKGIRYAGEVVRLKAGKAFVGGE